MIAYGRSAADRGCASSSPEPGSGASTRGCSPRSPPLPVIGVPVPLAHLDGLDSLLSIVQMPAGVPVATVSVGGRNAGLLAVRILGAGDSREAATLREEMGFFQQRLREEAVHKGDRLPPGAGDDTALGASAPSRGEPVTDPPAMLSCGCAAR